MLLKNAINKIKKAGGNYVLSSSLFSAELPNSFYYIEAIYNPDLEEVTDFDIKSNNNSKIIIPFLNLTQAIKFITKNLTIKI